jgi:hypothetical protein
VLRKNCKHISKNVLQTVVILFAVCLLVLSCVACVLPASESEGTSTTGRFVEPNPTTAGEPPATSQTTTESVPHSTSTSVASTPSSASGHITALTTRRRSETTTSTTASDKITVTIIVECRNAVQRKKEFSGLEDKIDYMIERQLCTSDGDMLKQTASYPRGTTVLDALLSLPLSVTVSTFNPGYIVAIGGLAEKEGGPSSGWIYYVNGVFVMKGSNQCILNDGDVVHWGYTIEVGDFN